MSEAAATDPLGWIAEEINRLKQQHLYRTLTVRESPHVAGKVQIAGRQLVNFGSNDYLALSANHRLVDAVKANAGYVGWGSAASPLVHGRGTLHERLEQEIARFEKTESALTFTSGFAANVGAITSLVGKPDAIFSDDKNHASIIDGCRLSRAQVFVYRHKDVNHLEELLLQSGPSARRRLIATDGLFSMNGDLAPLPEIVDLAKQHQAMLLVDEAHATGVFGEHGRGVSEHFGVHDQVDVVVGTLSKSLGCHGGFVAGSRLLVDWMINRARSYIFSTAVPDATCMAAVEAIHLVDEMKSARHELLQRASSLRASLLKKGFQVGDSASQIVPVFVGDPDRVVKARDQLLKEGYFVPAIRPPSVSSGESMLRISLNSQHDDEMIAGLVGALEKLHL